MTTMMVYGAIISLAMALIVFVTSSAVCFVLARALKQKSKWAGWLLIAAPFVAFAAAITPWFIVFGPIVYSDKEERFEAVYGREPAGARLVHTRTASGLEKDQVLLRIDGPDDGHLHDPAQGFVEVSGADADALVPIRGTRVPEWFFARHCDKPKVWTVNDWNAWDRVVVTHCAYPDTTFVQAADLD
jgi:hypothetical protein